MPGEGGCEVCAVREGRVLAESPSLTQHAAPSPVPTRQEQVPPIATPPPTL